MILVTKLVKKIGVISCFLLIGNNIYASFLDEQLVYSRVKAANQATKDKIAEKLVSKGLNINSYQVMIKAYKLEQILRVYVKGKSEKEWQVYTDYPFCWTSGSLGPKRKEYDLQIPEGYYHVNHFNPYSNFLLSLGINYPNKSDKIKSPYDRKGSGIYIHGGCATIGCIPIQNEPIQELYMLCVRGIDNGQGEIPVHLFPFYYTEEKFELAKLKFPEHADFWTNLFEVEQAFLDTKEQSKVSINKDGDYYLVN